MKQAPVGQATWEMNQDGNILMIGTASASLGHFGGRDWDMF